MDTTKEIIKQIEKLKKIIADNKVDNNKLYVMKLTIVKILSIEKEQLTLEMKRTIAKMKTNVKTANMNRYNEISDLIVFINDMNNTIDNIIVLMNKLEQHITKIEK